MIYRVTRFDTDEPELRRESWWPSRRSADRQVARLRKIDRDERRDDGTVSDVDYQVEAFPTPVKKDEILSLLRMVTAYD